MSYQQVSVYLNTVRIYLIMGCLSAPLVAHASFIESTMGAAVVNDATATYYNPANLILLKNPQLITLGSIAYASTQFTGQATHTATRNTQSGTAGERSRYYLPTLYAGLPITSNISGGIAVVANDFNKSIHNNSILRYVQSSNQIRDVDLVPAIGLKINQFLSVGAAINVSYAHFLLQPITNVASLTDSKSHNESSATSFGEDFGVLLKPTKSTRIGFNYRSAVTYKLHGRSSLQGAAGIDSDNYHFKFWTPARSTLSIIQQIKAGLGVIGTIQYIQWNIFRDSTIYNSATRIGPKPVILPNVVAHYHFNNTWLATVGGFYRFSPKWIVRVAGSYNPSPSSGIFQMDTGENRVFGTSIGYQLFKNVLLDCGYAHAFIKDKNIRINTAQNMIHGKNKGELNGFSLKLTFNI